MYDLMVLDAKDILQADATVIAGSLVLLTILFVFASDVEIAPMMKWVKSMVSVPAMTIIGLFSIFAILVVLGDILGVMMLFDFGKYLIVAGFVALVIGIGVPPQQFRKYHIL
ncbi:MAG: hypothetical protein WA220_00225 [Candidatus Nitrosopolaris sp.]